MLIERSCGAVVFTRENGQIKYVIIRSKTGFYGFPKGHMEAGETEAETALREIREETGLDVYVIDSFREEEVYPICCNGEQRLKKVTYFLAEYSEQKPTAEPLELRDICLLCYDDAISILQFETLKNILTHAHSFLTSRVKGIV